MDKKTKIVHLLALSIGLAAGLLHSACGQSPSTQTLAGKSQFQKLLRDTDKFLKQYETERKERKQNTDKSYKLCSDSISRLKDLAVKLGAKTPEKNVWLADVLMIETKFLELNGNISSDGCEQALAIFRLALPANSPKIAEAQNKLAYLYLRSGKTSDAADLLNQSIKIMEFNKGQGAGDLAEAIEKCMQKGMSRAVEAKRITRRAARSIAKYAPDNKAARASSLYAVSLCGGDNMNIFDKSTPSEEEKALAQALALHESNGSGNSLKTAELLETQAKNEERQGKCSQAVKTYKRVVTIREKLAAENFSLLGQTYRQYSGYLIADKNFLLAETYQKKILAFFEKSPGPNDQELRTALHNIAAFYANNKKLKDATSQYERIWALQKKHNDTNVEVQEQLAKLYIAMEDYSAAERCLKTSLEMHSKSAQSKPLDDDYKAIENLLLLATVQTKQGKLSEAGNHFQQLKSTYEKNANKFGFLYFGEKFPKQFLIPYVEYLEKANKKEEANNMKGRLEALLKKEATLCLGCGRG